MASLLSSPSRPVDLVDFVGHRLDGPASYPIEAPEPVEPPARKPHASPVVRAFARQLGVDLAKLKGSGPNERVVIGDVQAYVRGLLADVAALGGGSIGGAGDAVSGRNSLLGLALPPWPRVDFAKYGPVEVSPLPRIKRISGANLARNWVMIPHVTHHDNADVTSLEAFRQQVNRENGKSGEKSGAQLPTQFPTRLPFKVTMLAFLVKAAVAALKRFPDFNASLDGDQLVRKQYFHIGFAADTPSGLVVPVIRSADQKGVLQLAEEMSAMAALARDNKLGPADMQGGCFSISSLGGIGGNYFTPIINAPEVAILGVGKAQMKPVWDGGSFVPGLMLPLSLSYDHRVIDGAAAARFTTYVAQLLADLRRVVL